MRMTEDPSVQQPAVAPEREIVPMLGLAMATVFFASIQYSFLTGSAFVKKEKTEATVDISNWEKRPINQVATAGAVPEKIVAAIKSNRGKIYLRPLKAVFFRSENPRFALTEPENRGYSGFRYMACEEKAALRRDSIFKNSQRLEALEAFIDWEKNAQPSAARFSVAELSLWKDLSREGDLSAVNTYENKAKITWGRGFAAYGQLQAMLEYLFEIDPFCRQKFFAAGLSVEGEKFRILDCENGKLLEGEPAEEYLRLSRPLNSLFIEIAQHPAHRQNVLDAQFAQFARQTGNIPNFARNWSREAVAVVGHNIHYGRVRWRDFAGSGGDMKKIVRIIARKIGRTHANGAITVPSSKRIKVLGKQKAMVALDGPLKTPLDFLPNPGWVYFGTSEPWFYVLKD